MNWDELLDQLAQQPTRTYGYAFLTALVGPLVLRVFGLKSLAQLVRPAALVVLLGGMYAKQERAKNALRRAL